MLLKELYSDDFEDITDNEGKFIGFIYQDKYGWGTKRNTQKPDTV